MIEHNGAPIELMEFEKKEGNVRTSFEVIKTDRLIVQLAKPGDDAIYAILGREWINTEKKIWAK